MGERRTLEETLTREVVRNGLRAAAEEASIVVVQSSHSTFIQEGADACAALVDPAGQLVAQSVATTLVHSSSVRLSAQAVVESYPLAEIGPGDVFLMNDPRSGGIHANDMIALKPVVAEGEVVLFAASLLHVADVGGVAAGGLAALASDRFCEGLTLPPVRLMHGGKRCPEIDWILRANSRSADTVLGDIDALIAGVNVASASVESLISRYGVASVKRVIADDLDATEARMREEIAAVPDGEFDGRFVIDSDGVSDRTFEVRVKVRVDGDSMTLDFTGTSPQSGGAINASVSQSLSGVIFAVRCFVDPTLPMNEGCFRPISVILPPGTLVNPGPTAACGGRVVTVCAAIEAIIEALSIAQPSRAVAASGLVHVYALSGRARDRDWLTLLYDFGGIGARKGSDGPPATGAFFLGGRNVVSQVEPLESQYPLLVRSVRVREGSGGRGTWRGGDGIETVIEARDDAHLTVRGDRIKLPPPGRFGGEPGEAGVSAVQRTDGSVEHLLPKQTGIALAAGDRFVLRTSGGGGLGDPGEATRPSTGEPEVRS